MKSSPLQGAPDDGAIDVLLVEDNPADARLVEEALRDASWTGMNGEFRLAWVGRISDGVEHLQRGETDVALLDLTLPDARGLEALTAVRTQVPHVPVVVLTGLDDDELAVRAVREGAQDYFLKGQLQSGLLARAIRYAIERGREIAVQEQLLARERVARTEAMAANRAKSDFLAMMSHEMRTPLNAIIGYTQLLDLEIVGQLNDGQRDYVGRIDSSGKHMLTLINELLDLSKIEANQLTVDVRPAPMIDSVRYAIALTEPQARVKDIEVDVVMDDVETGEPTAPAESCLYVGDEARVQQVLINLLANAIQFTRPGGHVTARLFRAGSWISVAIEDSGIGIPAERFEAIFEPFVQIESVYRRSHGGAGLGLALSRRLVRLMGGEISVSSTPGEGSVFTMRLPAAS